MGRHKKLVLADVGLDRRETGYYSTPRFVVEYIVDQCLRLKPQAKSALDPCVGRGEFTRVLSERGIHTIGVDVMNLSPIGVDDFRHADFIQLALNDHGGGLFRGGMGNFDIVVANPPYNCHETDYIRAHKAALSKSYGKHALLNMYSLFLAAIIHLAKPGTIIGAITLDSFLTARGHEPLRRQIFSDCTVHEIRLCPTDLFRDQGADVRTCILILEKGSKIDTKTKISSRHADVSSFREALSQGSCVVVDKGTLFLSGASDRCEIQVGVPEDILALLSDRRLGDVMPCITGISTGNDKEYLRPRQCDAYRHPFYKNPGTRRFYTAPDAYLRTDFLAISERVPNFIVRNKDYLFQGGISCSSMGVAFGAAILPKGATFGVNANIMVSGDEMWSTLGYLNSSLVNFLVRSVLLRSNMITAGYVSRIPYPQMSSSALRKIGAIALDAYKQSCKPSESSKFVGAIDEVVTSELGLCEDTVRKIREFCSDIIRLS